MPEVSVRLLEERAKALGRAGEWGALALGINSRILEVDPDNLGALTRRARCNVALDEYAAAKADFQRALALGPESRMQREDLERGLAEVERGFEEAEGRAKKRREAAKSRRAAAEMARARARRRAEKRDRLLTEIGEIGGFEEARALGALSAAATGGAGSPAARTPSASTWSSRRRRSGGRGSWTRAGRNR